MWTLTKNKSWQQLQQYSWVKDMQGVPQSPVHHAEGSVAIHTQMVLEALVNLPEFKSLDQQAQENLWVAALMHDIEKRSTTTVDENADIISPGHAKKGAQTTGKILYRDFATPLFTREQIVGLVRYHGLPLWVFEKPDPVKAIIQASLEADTMLLALLATADVLGRICTDTKDLLYKIDLFAELAKEHDCWGKPRQFSSDLSKFQYFRKEGRHPDFESFDDTKATMILLSGVAGSGKDFYISKNYPDHPVVSLDDMRRKAKIRYGDTKGNGHIIQLAKETAKNF
ncbi:MAG: Poly(A) polymerase [Ferruginibacter sp.]|nr:Poly(A) polymerase [Ferruginibacter sp.]